MRLEVERDSNAIHAALRRLHRKLSGNLRTCWEALHSLSLKRYFLLHCHKCIAIRTSYLKPEASGPGRFTLRVLALNDQDDPRVDLDGKALNLQ